jgi:outer membrane receptor protein involved in Fe transport
MHSIYEEQFNPRAGLLFRLPAEVRVRATVARSFRAPTFNDLFWPDEVFTVGNPNLSPEKAWSYELGAEKKFDDKAVFKVAGFYRRVKDLIIWQPDDNFVFSPRNISSAKIWGTEVELSLYPLRNLPMPMHYSFTYPRDGGTGDPITLRPRHIFNVGIDYATSFGLKGGLHGRYTQYYRDQKTTLNKEHFVIDARVAYGFKVYRELQGEAFLSLHNALDREYQVTPDFPMPPRSLSGGVSFNF